MGGLWVAELYISDRTRQKIIQRHGITEEQVRDAVVCVSGLTFTWNEHPDRGRRAIVEAWTGGRRTLIVLYPAGSGLGDAWHLGSAYFVGY